MRILVIGAVAAGTSAAAKARRNNDQAEIVIYEKDMHISYSGCGLPYFIGGEIEELDELTPRNPGFFKKKYNIEVQIGHEVMNVNPDKKEITVKNVQSDETFVDTYDVLIVSTGATPIVPPVKGVDSNHVFFLRNVSSAQRIHDFIETSKPKSAVVVGTGFIGFEMLENLMNANINVTIVEREAKITPNLDVDMAQFLETTLVKKGVSIKTNANVAEITSNQVLLADGQALEADMVIMATGVRPNVELAQSFGVEIGTTGAIKVNEKMQTNIADVYACGDCIETFSVITNKPVYRPLGSTANKTGRIAGDVATGGSLSYKGNLSTGIFKLFDLAIATTGLSEAEALSEGYDIEICHNIKPDKPAYFHGKEMVIKAIADRKTQKLLGVQIVGYEGVDKRIDVFATLITYGATVDELFHLDLAYAPPFSTTKDPVHYTGMILDNALNHNRPIVTAAEIAVLNETQNLQIIDARVPKQYEAAHVLDAQNMPHSSLREQMASLDKDVPTVTYCNKGVTGNAAQNILLSHGFKKVYNLSGGNKFFQASKKK